MKFKFISKLLISSMLVSNLNVSSFASILSEDRRYEIFERDSININDILEEDEVDVKIKGSTLVNLIDSSTISEIDLDTKILSATTPTESHFTLPYNSDLLIDGRQYTIIMNVVENEIDEEKFEVSSYYYGFKETIRIPANYTGIFKAVVTRDSATNNGRIGQPRFYVGQHTKSQTIRIKDFMILEGDWTGKEIPEYFEGIQSSFEDQLVTQEMIDSGQEKAENLGKYKVEYKVTGKNKFNPNNVVQNKGITSIDGKITYSSNPNYHSSELIKIKPNTNYYRTDGNYVHYADSQLNYLGMYANGSQSPSNAYYCAISFASTTDYSESQLEEGSTATEYEPYRESIKTFYLNSPLLEGDTIEYIDEQPTHVKRSGQVVLNGSETWYKGLESQIFNNTLYFGTYLLDGKAKGSQKPISDTIPSNGSTWDSNCFTINIESSHVEMMLRIRVDLSKLSTQDVTGFKQWLRDNPTTVVYQLAEPIYEPIKADLSVELFEGTTYISNNSNIPANMKITVDRVANRAQEAIELAKNTPTVENLSQARYWTNLLKESTLKDSFQEQVDNILELEDLTIEKKTASVNADVYIKMKNTLSLSLDTNSIVFDEVDTTEDTEMQNAVNLTVSSSLPYRVNAYLEDEIYNADKSETLDKSILNIRANGKSAYQAFTDLSTPINLLDDQEAGVDTIHGIDLKLASNDTHKADIYKTTLKFEVEQK